MTITSPRGLGFNTEQYCYLKPDFIGLVFMAIFYPNILPHIYMIKFNIMYSENLADVGSQICFGYCVSNRVRTE